MKSHLTTGSPESFSLLQYLQSSHGLTRREFLQMIQQQAIRHDDHVITDMGYVVHINDCIRITLEDGSHTDVVICPLRRKKTVMVVFHKPTGYVVSKDDPHNKTIFELLPDSRRHDFYPIGRLDKESSGLLLLTNQPSLVDQYVHPRHQILKIYEVRTDKPMSGADCLRAKKGLLVDRNGKARSKDTEGNLIPKLSKKKQQSDRTGNNSRRLQYNHESNSHESSSDVLYVSPSFTAPEGVELLSCHDIRTVTTSKGYFVRISLIEGKNRHIRRLLKALGYRVVQLMRIAFGPYKLATIKPGRYMIQKVMS